MKTDIVDDLKISLLEDNLKNMAYALSSDGFCLNYLTLNVTCANTKQIYIVKMNEDHKIIFIWKKGGETDETDKTIEVRK